MPDKLPRQRKHPRRSTTCSNRLPHQFNPKEVRRCFPAATAAEELSGEEDQNPEAELADPVPALERRRWTPACSAGPRRAAPAAL